MIIYEATINQFIKDCSNPNVIANLVADNLLKKAGKEAEPSLVMSFKHSLPYMAEILQSELFNKELNVAIEYRLSTSSRADFVIYGKDEFDHNNVVVVELKQWSTVHSSNSPEHVFTNGGEGLKDYWHPSYQAFNYIHLLWLFNEYVRDNKINLNACSFMHYMDNAYSFILKDEIAFPLVKKAPAYLKDDADKLRAFIHRHVRKPCKELLYYIDNGKISPAPELAHMLADSLKGNPFFSYDVNQADAVAMIVSKTKEALETGKRATIIVRGGPGTGKSVVAINAMGQIVNSTKKRTNKHNNAVYISTNAAPRNYYQSVLKGNNEEIKDVGNFFRTPLVFIGAPDGEYDCALLDEAHRIYKYKFNRFKPMKAGTDMLEEIIRASKVNVFFVDEDQAVTSLDYATIDKIKEYAKKYNSPVFEGKDLTLSSQFRCIGGAKYIDWIRGILGYDGQQPFKTKFKDYRVEIVDSPQKMREEITKLNNKFGACRILAGYTHDWKSLRAYRQNGHNFYKTPYDFEYPDGFKMRWNKGMGMVDLSYSYLDDIESINEIGCIHTAQGLDLQYAGVIIGKDITYENGKIIFHKENNVDNDSAKISEQDDMKAAKLIRNTYNVLLTRGMRGTFIYCEDKALNEYFKSLLGE